MYDDIKSGPDKIKKDWLFILENLIAFKNLISDAQTNFEELPECLILAQKLSNQFDYFKAKYNIPNEVVLEAEFIAKKQERDRLYRELYKIFDELQAKKIINYIQKALGDHLIKYEMYISGLQNLPKSEWQEMLSLRDNIKILYDELEIWQGKWQGEQAKERFDLKDKLVQELLGYDNLLKEYFKKMGKEKSSWLKEEAENRLIPEPNGTQRYDFWWRRIKSQNV
jgi:hypothetical protein